MGSHSFLVLSVCTLACLCLLFLLADLNWESKKVQSFGRVPGDPWARAQRGSGEYRRYSWVRYLTIVLLTYVNVVGVVESKPENYSGVASPIRMLAMISLLLLFSLALLAIDGYWGRQRPAEFSGLRRLIFWFYFWLRYPALICATVEVTKRGLES